MITLKPNKNDTLAIQARSIDNELYEENGNVLSLFLSNKDMIAYVFGADGPAPAIERADALDVLKKTFLKYNTGTGRGSYGLTGWSVRRALGIDQLVLKIGIGRKIDADGTRANSRIVTFKNKVLIELSKLNFLAGASIRQGTDKAGDKTLSIMIYPIIGAVV